MSVPGVVPRVDNLAYFALDLPLDPLCDDTLLLLFSFIHFTKSKVSSLLGRSSESTYLESAAKPPVETSGTASWVGKRFGPGVVMISPRVTRYPRLPALVAAGELYASVCEIALHSHPSAVTQRGDPSIDMGVPRSKGEEAGQASGDGESTRSSMEDAMCDRDRGMSGVWKDGSTTS